MSRKREEIELSLLEAMNISVSHHQYISDKLTDMLHELSSSKIKDVLENIEQNLFEICSKKPSPNTSILDYLLEQLENIIYNICYSKNIIIEYEKISA